MSYCPSCGKEVKEGQNFCDNCGSPLNGRKASSNDNLPSSSSNNASSGSVLGWFVNMVMWVFILGIIGGGLVFAVPRLPMILSAAGISGGPGVQPLDVGEPQIESPRYMSGEGVVFDLVLPVTNPNSYAAKVDRIEYTVSLDNRQLGSGEKPGTSTVPANGQEQLRSSFDIDISRSINAGIGAVVDSLKGEETPLEVKGKYYFNIGPVSPSVPFEASTTV